MYNVKFSRNIVEEKCITDVHLNSTLMHLIYKNVNGVHIFGKSSAPFLLLI